MEPSEQNLILLAIVAFAMLVAAAVIFRVAGTLGAVPGVLLRIVGPLLFFVAFLMVGRTLWWEFNGSVGAEIVWWRSPTFYASAAVVIAGLGWLGEQGRGSVRARALQVVGLALVVAAVVGGSEKLIAGVHKSQSTALGLAVRGAAGQVAPSFEFVDLEERRHSLAEYKGQIVLLNFWSTTCGPCIAELPAFSALQERYGERGVKLVLLSSDEAPEIAAFLASHPTAGVKGRLISEERTPSFYHAYDAWPLTYLIDRNGVVLGAWIGEASTEHIAQLIERALWSAG